MYWNPLFNMFQRKQIVQPVYRHQLHRGPNAQKYASSIHLFFKKICLLSAILLEKPVKCTSQSYIWPKSVGEAFKRDGQYYLITCVVILAELLRLIEFPVSRVNSSIGGISLLICIIGVFCIFEQLVGRENTAVAYF